MNRIYITLMVGMTLLVAACAGSPLADAQIALSAAGYSIDAYCKLAPEGRAEIRRKLGIKAQLLCNDAHPAPLAGSVVAAPQTGAPEPTSAPAVVGVAGQMS